LIKLIVLLLLLPIGLSYDQTIIENCFIEQPRIAYIPTVYTNGSLIDCLALKESGNNPLAFNPCDTDGREKYGLLQFGLSEWETLCRPIGFTDIWNGEHQKSCADYLIKKGQLWRWGTVNKCKE